MQIQGSAVLDTVKSFAQTASSYLPQPISSGLSFASQLIPGSGGQSIDISPSYQALIEQQIRVQTEQQQVTLISNVEKSRHESRMAAVRNIRVG